MNMSVGMSTDQTTAPGGVPQTEYAPVWLHSDDEDSDEDDADVVVDDDDFNDIAELKMGFGSAKQVHELLDDDSCQAACLLDAQRQGAKGHAAAARTAADEAGNAARASRTKIEQLEAQIAELVARDAASDAASDARAQAVAQAASEAA